MVATIVGFHCKSLTIIAPFFLEYNCASSVYETVMNMAVPVPSTNLSKKLNTTNNIGVGIMDTNLWYKKRWCIYMHIDFMP